MADFSEDLFFSTITEWGAKLRSKEISALELARAFSARLEKLGPRYNALALPLSERAIKKAKELDGRAVLRAAPEAPWQPAWFPSRSDRRPRAPFSRPRHFAA